MKVICVGDNTVDCYLHLNQMYPGGNTVNVAVFASRLGHQSAYLGWLADDAGGMLIHQSLIDEGVNVSRCRIVEGSNAFCEIQIEDGDRAFGNFSKGVCDQISPNERDLQFISEFHLTHTSIYSHIDPFLKDLKGASNLLSYDFSNGWDQDSLAKILPYVDIAILSNRLVTMGDNRELMKWAVSLGPSIVMVTGGEKGAMIYDRKNYYYQPITRVEKLIDTLGAGDAFVACFLVNYYSKVPIGLSLQRAADYAAIVCTYHGAFGHGVPISIKTSRRGLENERK